MTRGDEMTEKKKLREQMAVHRMYSPQSQYNQPAPIQMREPSGKWQGGQGRGHGNVDHLRERRREKRGSHEPERDARVLHRVVSVPEADPSQAWNTFAQRQEQMRRARSRPQSYVSSKPIARTYAKTGSYASSGRIRAVQRSLAQQHSSPQASPIPTRSGRKSWLHHFWLRLVSLFAIVAVLVLVINLMFRGSTFRIAQVNVEGTHNSALVASIQRMGMQGQNIFLVNVEALTQRVNANPLVASTTLSKNWPNQITITITERVPVLLWQTPHGTYSVDSHGVVIAAMSSESAGTSAGTSSLMTVVDARTSGKGQKGQLIQPGTQLNANDVAFAHTIFQQLPRMTGVNTFTLHYQSAVDGAGVFVVQSSQGWKAYLGGTNDPNPLDNRLIELQQILQLAQQQQLTLASVDVRYGLYPVYTLKS